MAIPIPTGKEILFIVAGAAVVGVPVFLLHYDGTMIGRSLTILGAIVGMAPYLSRLVKANQDDEG